VLFEELVLPCYGTRLEKEVMPALRAAFFRKELEPLADLVRGLTLPDKKLQASIEEDYMAVRNHVLHGQVDYKGDGPLPEHWKQYIDRETNYFDLRHPKWTMDAEKMLIDLTVRAAVREGWEPRVRSTSPTREGLVEHLLELKEKVATAAPLIDKFLEGMPEWLQHNNAFTGGYLREDEVAQLREVLERERPRLEKSLKTASILPGWIDKLGEAETAGIGLSWTVL